MTFEGTAPKPEKLPKEVAVLSTRESDVLNLIVGGMSNSQIAADLGIGAETVKTHVRNLMAKLAAKDRTHAAIKAVKFGIV
jgi:DNA-binding NarL/FixJ family response regulator